MSTEKEVPPDALLLVEGEVRVGAAVDDVGREHELLIVDLQLQRNDREGGETKTLYMTRNGGSQLAMMLLAGLLFGEEADDE